MEYLVNKYWCVVSKPIAPCLCLGAQDADHSFFNLRSLLA
jgi:hypothetical protein